MPAPYHLNVDNNSEAALKTLTAFIGAVFGCIGCFAAMFTGDTVFGMLTLSGGMLCAALWLSLMIDGPTENAVDPFEVRRAAPAAPDATPAPTLTSGREPS